MSHSNLNMNPASLYRIGSTAALLQFAAAITLIIITSTLGLKPETAEAYFQIYQESRILGLLRGDFLSLILIALYLGTFPALYIVLKRGNPIYTAMACLFTFIGVTTAFAVHSDFSMLYLSEQYAAAASDLQRSQLLAAGEAVIASDIWNSTGGYMAGILLQGAGVMISIIMLRTKDFHKMTAYAGLLGNGIDLIQHHLHPFTPSISEVLMLIMGPFYLAWFPLLARDFLRLSRRAMQQQKTNNPCS